MRNWWKWFLIGAAAGDVAAFFIMRAYFREKGPISPPSPQIDTLYIRDTIRAVEWRVRHVSSPDTVWVPADTVRVRDTLMVPLPWEHIVWEDSLASVWISGVRPQVDSVLHYTTTQIVTKTVTVEKAVRTRWGVGVQAGATVAPGAGVQPYIGVGVSWNLLSW